MANNLVQGEAKNFTKTDEGACCKTFGGRHAAKLRGVVTPEFRLEVGECKQRANCPSIGLSGAGYVVSAGREVSARNQGGVNCRNSYDQSQVGAREGVVLIANYA